MTTHNTQMTDETLSGTGWTMKDAIEASVEARIEQHRYETDEDRVLARYDEADPLFPSFEVLELDGVNVGKLADALDAGLDARLFGLVFDNGLDIEGFNQGLETGLDIPSFNSGMEHLVEQQRLIALHSDPVERILCSHGECSCNS